MTAFKSLFFIVRLQLAIIILPVIIMLFTCKDNYKSADTSTHEPPATLPPSLLHRFLKICALFLTWRAKNAYHVHFVCF